MNLGRIITAMITPFDEAGAADPGEAARIARWLVDRGNDGLVIAGTTGEGPTLTVDERMQLFASVKEAVGDSAAVIANTGGNDTRSSVALTKEAQATAVDAILAVVPYYNKPTQEGMIAHFGALAEATSLPIIIYNIPGRTGVNMLPETLLELARSHKNIVGVKESSGDVAQFSEILRNRAEGFLFYCGDDHLFLPSLALGGDGVVGVASHFCSREYQRMAEAIHGGRVAEACGIHYDLVPLINALFATTSPIPVKWGMNHLGFKTGETRLPLCGMPKELQHRLKRLLEPFTKTAAA
ncbi:MAG: 4-hydroxy-tetrahydrodipicolinate synthase [Candidatus Meridianibacter frigidus]|nr:MAG: 4-hydroxy-tetrahydrodipicolinate synthase [Candidatus Eremiobacteraeota bacterium]